MKNLYIFIFLLLNTLVNGQNFSGRIEYSLIYKDIDKLKGSEIESYYKSAKDNAKYVTLILDFNKEGMSFYNNSFAADGTDLTFSLAFCGITGKYFRENGNDITTNIFDNRFLGKIKLENNTKISWNLINESKKINNFLCYKASTVIKYSNGVGDFQKDLVVWYCPQIPYAYGPFGYGTLSGIILEYQYDNYIIGAKKIVFDDKFKFKIPTEGKLMTESEYLKLNQKAHE